MATFPIKKLLLVALLGATAVFLGTVVVTLQLMVVHYEHQLEKAGGIRRHRPSRKKTKEEDISPLSFETKNPSVPLDEDYIRLWRQYSPLSNDIVTAAKAYWRLAQTAIQEWDAALHGVDESFRLNRPINKTYALLSLEKAAELGNSDAQYQVANALASGIWPIEDDSEATRSLRVTQDMMPSQNSDDHKDHKEEDDQIIESQLLYRMAAIDGNVDSSVALGYRYFHYSEASSSLEHHHNHNCKMALPFYEAAAHGVMDELEASPQHRGKIQPPMDKHVLAQVHLHGGTSSRLQVNNKPDEQPEALQYYHIRATQPVDPDLNAAYTLGHLYHYGVRGVPQNMTLALKYYEIAANHDHAEAAGQAGKFYFWALGMDYEERDLTKAYNFFRVGTPGGYPGCNERLKRSKKKKKNNEDDDGDDSLCDHPSLNGMGLLHLYGIPHMLPVNYDLARNFFKLSKQMGNMDASYNLAMMNLGLKEKFIELDEDEEPHDSISGEAGSPMTMIDPLKAGGYKKPYNGPSKVNYQHAASDLIAAANMGHIQARHRLGMMYSHGVVMKNVEGNNKDLKVVNKDCTRALNQFKYVVDNASLSLSRRTRHAYKQYMAGNYEESLRNYMAAAETGSEVAQVNAAFLLERGVCLNLSPLDCARASVRYWKAAAHQGNAEACLRVGDFYYYGRLRQEEAQDNDAAELSIFRSPGLTPVMGPFPWIHYLVYPERLLPHIEKSVSKSVNDAVQLFQSMVLKKQSTPSIKDPPAKQCEARDEDGTCAVDDDANPDKRKSRVASDLANAAHYYRMAAEEHKSQRANFNLGFMHEWGLGLSQDFPLAKRHYDLAAPPHSQIREGETPVQIALVFLSLHEKVVRLLNAWDEWHNRNKDETERARESSGPAETQNSKRPGKRRKAWDVVLSHIVSWESVLIVILTVVLSVLVRHRRTRPR